MNTVEIMDCQDIVADLDFISSMLREVYHVHNDNVDWCGMADDVDKAADKLLNLVERLRSS